MRQARAEAEKARADDGRDLRRRPRPCARQGEALFAKGEFASATRAFLESRDGFDRARRAVRAPVAAAGDPSSEPPAAGARVGRRRPPLRPPPWPAPRPPPSGRRPRSRAGGSWEARPWWPRGARAASIEGFDTADVKKQKMPDFVGRIEFETAPAAPARGQTPSP